MPVAISFSLLYCTNFTNFLLCRLDQAKPVSGPSNVDSNPILWSFLPCPNTTYSHQSCLLRHHSVLLLLGLGGVSLLLHCPCGILAFVQFVFFFTVLFKELNLCFPLFTQQPAQLLGFLRTPFPVCGCKITSFLPHY